MPSKEAIKKSEVELRRRLDRIAEIERQTEAQEKEEKEKRLVRDFLKKYNITKMFYKETDSSKRGIPYIDPVVLHYANQQIKGKFVEAYCSSINQMHVTYVIDTTGYEEDCIVNAEEKSKIGKITTFKVSMKKTKFMSSLKEAEYGDEVVISLSDISHLEGSKGPYILKSFKGEIKP